MVDLQGVELPIWCVDTVHCVVSMSESIKLLESDVVHFQVLGTHIVIVNSTKAAKDLFEKQSHIYSDK